MRERWRLLGREKRLDYPDAYVWEREEDGPYCPLRYLAIKEFFWTPNG